MLHRDRDPARSDGRDQHDRSAHRHPGRRDQPELPERDERRPDHEAARDAARSAHPAAAQHLGREGDGDARRGRSRPANRRRFAHGHRVGAALLGTQQPLLPGGVAGSCGDSHLVGKFRGLGEDADGLLQSGRRALGRQVLAAAQPRRHEIEEPQQRGDGEHDRRTASRALHDPTVRARRAHGGSDTANLAIMPAAAASNTSETRAPWWERHVELVVVIMLGIVSVATAYTSFQSSLYGGQSADKLLAE